MKKVLNVGLGGVPFVIDEDAYARLGSYLQHYRNKLSSQGNTGENEIMDDLEERIADLLKSKLNPSAQVVSLSMVEDITAQLGMPDGSAEPIDTTTNDTNTFSGSPFWTEDGAPHRLYRDPDQKAVAGVCSGLAAYFNVDVALIRIVFLLLLLCGSAGGWIYLIIWVVTSKATTPEQKCELRGLKPTEENLAKFTKKKGDK